MTQPVVTPTDAEPVSQSWQRLDTRMLLIAPLVELFKALPVLVPLLFFGQRSSGGAPWGLIGAGVVALLAVFRWATTTYRVTEQNIQVRKGLLHRTTRTVPRDRIRTVDVSAHLLHRALRLKRLAAGTGRSDRRKDEGFTLDGLAASEAERLRHTLLVRDDAAPAPSAVDPTPVRPPTVLAGVQLAWVRFAPFTTSGIVTVLAGAGVVWNAANESHIDPTKEGPGPAIARHLGSQPFIVAAIEVAIALFLLVALAAICGYLLTFWQFRLERQAQGSLHVSRGLLTTRQTTIEERRLRGAELSQPLLLRAVGGAQTLAIATGLRTGRGAERGGSVLLPPAPVAVARSVAVSVLAESAPVDEALRSHGRRATVRRYSRALSGAGLLLLLTLVGWAADVLSSPAWLLMLLVVPFAVVLAWDRARGLGHALTESTLVTQHGSLGRRRSMLRTEGVIGWNLRSSWFQRRAGLLTLTATTAAGRQAYHVLDVPADVAEELAAAVLPAAIEPFLVGPMAQ